MAKQRVRVIAENTVVAGHRHGEEFELDPDESGLNLDALLQGGHLEAVSKPKKQEKEE